MHFGHDIVRKLGRAEVVDRIRVGGPPKWSWFGKWASRLGLEFTRFWATNYNKNMQVQNFSEKI